MIIDAHLHLDDRVDGPVRLAVEKLVAEMALAKVDQAVVLHLLWQPWPIEEVAETLAKFHQLVGFANVDPKSPTALVDLKYAATLGFRGLKLHPRLQKYSPTDPACVELVRLAGEMGFPVTIDCFPDGDWLMAGLSVLQYAELAKAAPQTKLVVAHAAGHHCLDLLMLMKRIPNLWLDVSYSLLYYGSPVTDALFYCLKSLRYERALFGTDYPDRSLPESVLRSLTLFDQFGVKDDAADALLCRNFQKMLPAR